MISHRKSKFGKVALGAALMVAALSPTAHAQDAMAEHRPVSVDIANNGQINICFVHLHPDAHHLRVTGSVGRGAQAQLAGPLRSGIRIEAFAGNQSVGIVWPSIPALPRRGHMPLARFHASFDDATHAIDHILIEAVDTRS